jgi:hypothetical protein
VDLCESSPNPAVFTDAYEEYEVFSYEKENNCKSYYGADHCADCGGWRIGFLVLDRTGREYLRQ